MSEFKSVRSYWDFHDSVHNTARYVRTPEVEDFLHTVRETGQARATTFESDKTLWRAQLGYDSETETTPDGEEYDVKVPYPPRRMKPQHNRAREGRANSKGIPHLYLATIPETAIAEVRPWIDSTISVAKFEITRPLKILDCSGPVPKSYRSSFTKNGPVAAREPRVWDDINRAFARPVSPTDDVADYVPTQIIAELFKADGFDGIAYRSSLVSTGSNVVLFDTEVAILVNCGLSYVKSLQFDFSPVSNLYVPGEDGKNSIL